MIDVKDQEARALEFVHSIGQGGLDASCFAADMSAWSAVCGLMTVEFNDAREIRHVREYMDSARALNILVPAMKEGLSAQAAQRRTQSSVN